MAAIRVCKVRFEEHVITTTVTASGAAVKSWLDETLAANRRRLVGLDVEWRPTFRPGAYNKTALLQLCADRRCLIFQLLHADHVPSALKEFLGDSEHTTFAGVGVQADAKRLRNDYGLEVEQSVDLAPLAAEKMGRSDLRYAGLKGIAAAVMDAQIEKPRRVRIGCWDAKELSDEQVKYACTDAFVSFEVGRRLLDGDY